MLDAFAGNSIAAYIQTSSPGSQAAAGTERSYPSAASIEVTEQLMLWCKARLNASAVPISIAVLPQIPVSTGGKLARGALPPPSWAAEGMRLPFQDNSSLSEGETLHSKQASEGEGMSMKGNTCLSQGDALPNDPALEGKRMSVKGNSSLSRSEGLLIEPTTVGDDVSFQELPTQTSMAAQKEHSLKSFIPVTEGRVLGLFREALGLSRLEPTESFFQAGGDSLAAAAVANSLVIPPDMLTAFPTARALAAAMRRSSSARSCEPHVTPVARMAEAMSKNQPQSDAQLTKAPQMQPARAAPPLLSLNTGMDPAVAAAAEEEKWQQQAQQEVLRCSQAGGWVFERAGGQRWAGAGTPTDLLQTLGILDKHSQGQNRGQGLQSPVRSASAAPHWESQQQMQPQQQKQKQQQQQQQNSQQHAQLDKQHKASIQQQQQQQPAEHLCGELHCAWRCKLKECVDASPVVLVTCTPQDTAHHQTLDSQEAAWQLHKARPLLAQEYQQQQQQQQQQHVAREWVFACSHGGDVVCVEGQSGRAVWQAALLARAEAGLTITSDCMVSIFFFFFQFVHASCILCSYCSYCKVSCIATLTACHGVDAVVTQ